MKANLKQKLIEQKEEEYFLIRENFDNYKLYDDLNVYDEQYNKYVNLKYYIMSFIVIFIFLFIIFYFLFKK